MWKDKTTEVCQPGQRGNAVNRCVPSKTVLARAREKVAADLGNVHLEQTLGFWLLWVVGRINHK